MQATKDSFYLTLRDRLAQADPGRTITVDGITRPAIVVVENDKPSVTRATAGRVLPGVGSGASRCVRRSAR